MDKNNIFHLHTTEQTMKETVKQDVSPILKRLVADRIQILQPGKLRLRNDNYGS